MILQEGHNRIRDLHTTDLTNGIMGTASTTVVETQTGLQAPVSASEIALTKTNATKTTTISYTLLSTTGTGVTYREFGTNDGSTTDYDRVIFTGIEHTSADDIVIRKSYYYENG